MPFGVVSGVSRMMGVLDGVMIVEVEGAVLGVNLGRPTVTNWTMLNSSATATRSSQITLRTCFLWFSLSRREQKIGITKKIYKCA